MGMSGVLNTLFEGIGQPITEDGDGTLYTVRWLPGNSHVLVGKDRDSLASVLIRTKGESMRRRAPIALENMDVQFGILCRQIVQGERAMSGRFTVIRCLARDRELKRYFLSVCEVVLQEVGTAPRDESVAKAIARLARVLESTQYPPRQRVDGLFGELFVILRCRDPVRAVAAWRIEEESRFDFVDGHTLIDVKVSRGPERRHWFSYHQCNVRQGQVAVVVSALIERRANGLTMEGLVDSVCRLVEARIDLVLKIHEVVATTLGTALSKAMTVAFDERGIEASMRLFDMREIPAVRCKLPHEVSQVRFRVDLSKTIGLTSRDLVARGFAFESLLPGTWDAR